MPKKTRMAAILKRVPKSEIPKNKMGRQNMKYPFETMKIGESFVESEKPYRAMLVYASKRGAYYGRKFRVTKQDDGSLRVYRLS